MKQALRRLNIQYFLLQLLFWGAGVVIYAYTTPILEYKGYTEVEIGILTGTKLLVGLFFQIWIGDYADRHRYTVPLKRLITICAGLSMVFTVALYLIGHNFPMMFLVSIGFGISFTTISPLLDSLPMLYVHHGVNVNYAKGRMGGSISWALFCVVAGRISDSCGMNYLPLWGVGFLLLLAFFSITMPWQNIKESHYAYNEGGGQAPHRVTYLLKNYPVYTVFLVGSAVMFMGYNLGTTFMIDVVGLLGGGSTEYGIVEFIMAISEVPSGLIVLKCKERIPIKWMMLCCAIFMTLKNLIPTFATNLQMVYVAQICEMLGFGLFYTGSVYLIMKLLPEGDIVKATTLISVATVGIGEGIASLACGVIKAKLGLHGLMLCSTWTNALAIFIILWMCLKKNAKEKATD